MRSLRAIPLTIARGFVMGAADVVPGVSGGTVALVFGIYHRLIEAVRTGSRALAAFLRFDLAGGMGLLRQVEWLFLLPLLSGIGLAVITLSGAIEHLLEENPVEMAGLFLGLVAGSGVVAWRLLTRRDGARIAVLVVSSAVTFVALGLRGSSSAESVNQIEDPALWAFFGAGAIAICAMILPGVSGSFLLVTLGMYQSVLGAVNDRDLVAVAVFGVGCVIGLALFSQGLHWALTHHYDTVMAGLIGLMVGSIRVVWPWPGGVDSTTLGAPADPVVLPIVLAAGAFAVVLAFDLTARRLEKRSTADEVSELQAS